MDSGLIVRDLKTDLGTILVEGNVNRAKTPYTSLRLKIYRDSVLICTLRQNLVYKGTSAPFCFSYSIPAGLHEYTISLYGKKKSVITLDTSINGIVAGDVFIIEGQSNAFATMRDKESANANKSEFIRVFGNPDPNPGVTNAHSKWFVGQGDGDFKENGHAGQWGLRLGRLLVDSIKMPVAIFNGAFGGTPISYYERAKNYKTELASNYARLYHRLTLTGLQNHVRAIIWSQGESDVLQGTKISTYMNELDTLLKNWKQDYPAVEKIYIFQTAGQCYLNYGSLLPIAEAQREVALKHDSVIEIIPTSALKPDKGGLHFDYKGGYEIFGDRIFSLISRDLYGVKSSHEIDAPMITSAFLNDSTTIIVTENARSIIPRYANSPIQNYGLRNSNGAVIDSVFPLKNNIIFLLSKYPGKKVTISYYADSVDGANRLTNSSGIEILTFCNFPVTDSIGTTMFVTPFIIPRMKVYPKIIHTVATVKLNLYGKYTIELDDLAGRTLKQDKFTGIQYDLDIPGLTRGMYFIRIFDKDKNLVGTSKMVVQ